MLEVKSGFCSVMLDYLIKFNDIALVYSVFDRSQTKVRRVCVEACQSSVVRGTKYKMIRNLEDSFPARYIETFPSGREIITSGLVINSRLNKEYVITTRDEVKIEDDVYSLFMNNFSIPILREWMEFLIKYGMNNRCIEFDYYPVIYSDEHVVIDLGNGEVRKEDVVVVRNRFTEESLKSAISYGLRTKQIFITRNEVEPLNFKNLDEYYARYGANVVNNLTTLIKPLSETNGLAGNVATRSKRLFPAQGNIVNGLIERLKVANFAILNMDMGTGKTLQALSAVDGYFNTLAMEKNGKDLKQIMLDEDVSYRAAVICPGHLVDKWCDEATQLYGMRAIAIKDLESIIKIQQNREKYSKGKWLFVFAKDSAKLGDMQAPVPTKWIRGGFGKLQYCAHCMDESKQMVFRQFGQHKCPSCGGREYRKKVVSSGERGLICPNCNELLIANVSNVEKQEIKVLSYNDFETKKKSNLKCYHCGASLWGSQVRNINATHDPTWKRVWYFSNKSHKTKKSCWVHKDKYEKFGENLKLDRDEYGLASNSFGNRKYSLARYISKHMKNFFDFLIADECHMYETSSAQGEAFASLVRVSKKTLALTGTLTNGYANGLFYMFWRLNPQKMVSLGYTYDSDGEHKWNEKYGIMEARGKKEENYNTTSRGKASGAFKLKPGVNPQIVKDMLLDCVVQLQISELSDGLPELNEKIVSVETENKVYGNLFEITDILKNFAREFKDTAIAATALQYQLFYADHPYGMPPIRNPIHRDKVLIDTRQYDCSELVANGRMLNKEKELIRIVESELEEKRRCYVFVENTGKDGDFFILKRIREIVSKIPGAKPLIMEANTVAATRRESWLREQVEKNGYNVIISNPRLVETGIDFIWYKEDVEYNIPTIIFYQVGYRLDTLWQASRRHYRLIQKSECRTYYLVSKGTMQLEVLSLMAEKQVAVSAIQGGEFSSRGLASMAKGVDPKIELARRMQEGEYSSVDDVENMFKAITRSGNRDWKGVKNYLISDVLGEDAKIKTVVKKNQKKTFIPLDDFDDLEFGNIIKSIFESIPEKKSKKKVVTGQINFGDLFK